MTYAVGARRRPILAGVVTIALLTSCALRDSEPDWVGTSGRLEFDKNSCVGSGRSAARDQHGNVWRAESMVGAAITGIISYTSGDRSTFQAEGSRQSIPLVRVPEGDGEFVLMSCSF